MKLKDKVVVVTGGAGLLGSAFCKAIAAEGGIAVIADSDTEKAAALSGSIAGSSVLGLDITSRRSLEEGIAALIDRHGRIDALVNNAYPRNRNYGRHFFDVEYADFCENLGLNLGGYFLASQCFLRHFFGQGWGNIVNISSIYGVIAPRFEVYGETGMTMPVEYAAIKSGLIHLTRYMAKYASGRNINVNCISPGGILDRQPEDFLRSYRGHCTSKGMLDPVDLTGALVFLLSADSRFINGQNLIVDDGFTL